MQDLSYLDDPKAREAVLRIAEEAAQHIRPQEAFLARDIAEEYLDEVRKAGKLLYVQSGRGGGMGFDGSSVWLMLALPTIVGCLGNLMAEAGVRMLEAIQERRTGSTDFFDAAHVRSALAVHAQAAGLTEADVERLVVVVSAVLVALLTEGKGSSRP